MPLLYDPILKDKRLGETVALLFTSTATVTLANSITETSLLSTGIGSLTIPAHFFLAGKSLIIQFNGYFSTGAAGTLDIKTKIGSTTIGDTGVKTPIASLTDKWWEICSIITCRTTGSSGTVFAQGIFKWESPSDTRYIAGWGMDNQSTITLDTTAGYTIGITAQWGTADTANTITQTNGFIKSMSIN